MTSAPFTSSADCYQARIATPDGRILGSGVLIAYNLVLTCAHVLDDADERPTGEYLVEFPRAAGQAPLRGRVPADGWRPQSRADLAILELDGEPDDDLIRPARLGPAAAAGNEPAKAYGHPPEAPDGLWARLDVSGSTGREQVQLVPRPGIKADRIAVGFSGGPVVLEVTATVIGIVVSTLQDPDWVAGWMIPMEIAARELRHVRNVMPMTGTGADDIDPAALDALAETLSRLPHLAGPVGRRRIGERLPAASKALLPPPPPSARDLVHACRRPADLRILVDLARYFDTESYWDNRLERQLDLMGVPAEETVAAETEALVVASMRDLRQALADLPYFRDARTRHLYLEAVTRRMADELHREIRLGKTDDVLRDAEILLRECRRIPGALQVLPKDFPAGDHRRREFQRVETMINHLTRGHLMLDRERRELLMLIRERPEAVIRGVARRARPWPVGESVPDDPVRVVEWVENRAQRPYGLPRIVEFAEELALRVEDVPATALRHWSDRFAARQHLKFETVQAFRRALAEAAAAEDEAPVLTVLLAPDAPQPYDHFLLEAVLDHRGERRVVALSGEPETLDAIRARIDRVLDDTYELLDDDDGTLRLEVIVPRVLLNEPIDRWELQEEISVPIGEKLPVVLRSYERMRNRRVRAEWMKKWQLAREQPAPDVAAMVHIGPDENISPREVYEQLSPDRKLLLALGRPPARPSAETRDVFSGAMQAGIAYVVWIRDVSKAAEFRTAMHRLLAEIPVREVPVRIAQWRAPGRAETFPGIAGLAEQVSLMVCDPDRREPIAGRTLGAPPPRRSS